MKILISPREITEIAFAGSPGVTPERISEAVIIAAQQKFIRPALGGLYKQLEDGRLTELLDQYIKPALAHYVKLIMIPRLAVSVGDMGIVSIKSAGFGPAEQQNISALRKATRSDACALMRAAIEHIEENPELYPEYDPEENILGRISICSQIVL